MMGKISGKNDEKGFGFITPDGMEDKKENNVFFHSSALMGVSFEELAIGNMVSFETEASDKGPRAVNVQKA
jgi:CspA family cold shock protein